MCVKIVRKMCCMIVFSIMVGGVVYYLRSKDSRGREKGCVIADEMKQKKAMLRHVAGDIKRDMSDMKDMVKEDVSDMKEFVKESASDVREEVRNAAAEAGSSSGEQHPDESHI